MNPIQEARAYAHEAHDSIGQKRKYSGDPYWVHTDEVAGIVLSVELPANYTGPKFTQHQFNRADAMIAAAHLHDVVEDVFPKNPAYSLDAIRMKFGNWVAELVDELTDKFTKQNYPEWNRAQRKLHEADRLGTISDEGQTIKAADLISNSKDILARDPDFAKTYLREKQEVLDQLTRANPMLLARARNQIGFMS